MESYELIREINRGGFGIVELVSRKGLYFARKTFAPGPGMNSDDVDKHRKRFVREVRYQKSFPEDFCVPILDSCLEGDSPWFIMPLAEKTYAEQINEDKQNRNIS